MKIPKISTSVAMALSALALFVSLGSYGIIIFIMS